MNYNLNPAFARLTIHIVPSHLLAFIFVVMGFLACFCLLVVPINIWPHLLLTGLIIACSVYAIQEHALLKLPRSIKQLDYRNETWVITYSQDEKQKAKLHASSFVSAYFTVINVTVEGQWLIRSILIIPSRVDSDAFRRLRIILRWHKETENIPMKHTLNE